MALFSRAFIRKRVISLATTMTVSASSFAVAQNPATLHHVAGTVRMQMAGSQADPSEAPFLLENDAAMTKMMRDMSIKASGDVDHDFVEMMVPHHQGAIDMARAVLRHGHNEQLRRLAQEIIVTQQQEIAAMRLALGQPLPDPVASPTEVQPAMQPGNGDTDVSHHPMTMK